MIGEVRDQFLFDGPDSGRRVVLAHGAGAPMDSPFMTRIALGLAAGGLRVVRFEFPYMRRRRNGGRGGPPDPGPLLEAHWRAVIAELGDPATLVIGGKSLGGRIASMVADEADVAGLVALGYPFHPPSKPERPRTAHLLRLRTPALIVQGTRDPFGTREEVERYGLPRSIRVAWLEDGDHSLAPRARSGRTPEQNLEACIEEVLGFLRGLPS